MWAEKRYDKFYRDGDYQKINLRLINEILIRIKDLQDEIEDIRTPNHAELKYVAEEVLEIIQYLKGSKNYSEIYKVKVDGHNSNSMLIEKCIEKLLSGKIVEPILLDQIREKLSLLQISTKEDILYSEVLQSIILTNECLELNANHINIGTLGVNVNNHTLEEETRYLRRLVDVFSGNGAYRFSLVLKQNTILYTNFYLL